MITFFYDKNLAIMETLFLSYFMTTPKNKSSDTYSYKGWLQSDFFIKRAFAIFGHYLIANIIVSIILIVIGLLIALLIGGAALLKFTNNDHPSIIFDEDNEQIFCTQDAMLCPDGSSVGRIAPDCNFTPCPDTTPNALASIEYNERFLIKVNEQVISPNGMLITLKEIDDQRCPADIQCIWEGEYRATFQVISPVDDVRTFTLGSVREKEQAYWGYTFKLQSANDNQVEMIITL